MSTVTSISSDSAATIIGPSENHNVCMYNDDFQQNTRREELWWTARMRRKSSYTSYMVWAQRALGLKVGAMEGAKVGPVGPAVGAKVGPVGTSVTPAGNLSSGIAHHLR